MPHSTHHVTGQPGITQHWVLKNAKLSSLFCLYGRSILFALYQLQQFQLFFPSVAAMHDCVYILHYIGCLDAGSVTVPGYGVVSVLVNTAGRCTEATKDAA